MARLPRRPTLTEPLIFPGPVTLVGGGALTPERLAEAEAIAPRLIAADGAVDRLARWDRVPEAVIGDMDSIEDPDAAKASGARIVALAEQDTTDFEKCLYATDAPLYIAAGFTGRRLDHTLAVMHGMLARPDKRVVLLGEAEVVVLLRPGEVLAVAVEVGAVVSLFPLLPSRGLASTGLAWPIDGLDMAPGLRTGTSNHAVASRISVAFDRAGVFLMLPRPSLRSVVAALDVL